MLRFGGQGKAPNKRILNEGRPIIEGVMELVLLASLPLVRMMNQVSMRDGRLVKTGSESLITWKMRMIGAQG